MLMRIKQALLQLVEAGFMINMYAANGSGNYALTQVNDAAYTPIGSQASWNAAYNTYRRCQMNGAALLDAFFRSEGVI